MMSDVNVVLTNDPPGAIPGGGDVNFAGPRRPVAGQHDGDGVARSP